MGPRARLTVLTVVVTAVPVVLALTDVISVADLRDTVREFGPLAPLAWVLISAALGAALFPGPLLAGASGALFGAAVGTITTVCSAVVSAMVSREIWVSAGGPSSSVLPSAPCRAPSPTPRSARRSMTPAHRWATPG